MINFEFSIDSIKRRCSVAWWEKRMSISYCISEEYWTLSYWSTSMWLIYWINLFFHQQVTLVDNNKSFRSIIEIRFHFVYLDLMKCNHWCADVYRLVERIEICSLMKKLCFLFNMMIDCLFVSVKCINDMAVCHRYFFRSHRQRRKRKRKKNIDSFIVDHQRKQEAEEKIFSHLISTYFPELFEHCFYHGESKFFNTLRILFDWKIKTWEAHDRCSSSMSFCYYYYHYYCIREKTNIDRI